MGSKQNKGSKWNRSRSSTGTNLPSAADGLLRTEKEKRKAREGENKHLECKGLATVSKFIVWP